MTECRVALLGVMAVAFGAAAVPVNAGAEPRAVVELFTSQGCSSCPAADQVLGELSEDPSIITMSLPIDYWDYIGWKDTLALPGHTKRQWAYAHALGDRGVYTPQAVVNGSMQVVGSDRAAIENAITQSQKHADALTLPVSLSIADGQIKIAAATSKAASSGEVWLCSLSRAVPVVIGRGENHGRTITYHNVVRHWAKVGEWTGAAGTWTVPVKDVQADGVDEVAVVVQAGNAQNPGAMLGAAITALH
jgi:hypothetical protein